MELSDMQELIHYLGRCSLKAAAADCNDLQPLADLHTDLLAIHGMAAGTGSNGVKPPEIFTRSVEHIANAIEKLVLGEEASSDFTMKTIARQIDELRGLIDGATPAYAPPGTKPAMLPVTAIHTGSLKIEEQVINEGDAALALEFVGEAISHLEAAEISLLKIEEEPGDQNEVNAVFRAFHTIKGVAGFLGLKQIGALAHAAETLLDLARKGKLQLNGTILDVVLESRDVMGKMVGNVEIAAKSFVAPALQGGLDSLLARLDAATHGGVIPVAVATPLIEETLATSATAQLAQRDVEAVHPANAPASNIPTSEGVVKVTTSRLDALIDAVGELVIGQAMVTQDLGTVANGNQRLARNLSHLGKITRGLQELSMSMRMVPIAAVFQKMARLSRDVSRKAGKEIDFIQQGGETELDRNVVDAISDPLMHMVRNSIDHGVETPEDREKAGKPRAGRVVLKACHQAGNIVVEITDDGKGLNQERIVQKAIAAGIVKEGQELSEQQIFQLIFHPGLSTAEKITDISGRGVGMDVVKKNVEALRGRIEIASTPGKGSVFTVRLPLTLAVIDGLIVRVGTQRYILPILSIEQSIRPSEIQLSTVQGKGELCLVRDRLIPIVRLHELFHVTPKTTNPTEALVVIVQEGPDRCCLLVDELIGQQQVVIKAVGKEIGDLPGIAGCAILGDGNVSLILDVGGIIHSALK
jgi:two-component system chemotaxis sensor kinase CheA